MLTRAPETPAALAGAILDHITARPNAFAMSSWIFIPECGRLDPTDEPDCGTTMCVAGWAAHLTGWTLVDADEPETEFPEGESTSTYAEKDGIRMLVEDVARAALGNDVSFYGSGPEALEQLRRLAGR
ncbi:hypothetical protein [Streptomyces sp. NPDC091212]|uniref:hypothetical protein n=1 Tax=Streptomyces sp. NPDC091212 TaxID=3155191 RepID=UPI00344A760D